jgi:hypothetical protein
MTGSRSLIGLLVLGVTLYSASSGSSPAHSSTIFDSRPTTAGVGGCTFCESGNLVGFAGADRDLTDFSLRYQAFFALAERTAIVRFYALDGGAPGPKLFESAPIAAPGSSGQIDIHGIGIHVPDSLLWTVTFTAPPPPEWPPFIDPDTSCICIRFDAPDLVGPAVGLLQIGSADGSGWYRFVNQDNWNPLYPALFAARFDAEGSEGPDVTTQAPPDPRAVPFPGTLVLLTAATAVVAWRRRKGSAKA